MYPYRRFLTNLLLNKGDITVAEVGVFEGDLTNHLLKNCQNIKMLYAVDTWISYSDYEKSTPKKEVNCAVGKIATANWNRTYTNFVIKMKKYNDRVVILRKDSLEAAECFEDEFFDFVFIDANHGYNYVSGDIWAWTRKVKVGGIVAGHDYVDKAGYGVIEAVNQFFGNDFERGRGHIWYHERKNIDNYDLYRNWSPPQRNLGPNWYLKRETECDGTPMVKGAEE